MDFIKKIFEDSDGNILPYNIIAPKNQEEHSNLPLVLFLHGLGERGTDNEIHIKTGINCFVDDDTIKKYNPIVVAPQCNKNDFWVNTDFHAKENHIIAKNPTKALDSVFKLIDFICDNYPVDKNRIYMTGLSMGGFGTWESIARKPDTFAAAIPICGGADISTAKIIYKIPIWAFHCDGDPSVNVERTRSIITAIKKVGGTPKYTEYKDNSHDAWTKAFSDEDMKKWLFSQRK